MPESDYENGFRPLAEGELPRPGDEFTDLNNDPGTGFLRYAGYGPPDQMLEQFRWRTNRPAQGPSPVEMLVLVHTRYDATPQLVPVTDQNYRALDAGWYSRDQRGRRMAAPTADVVITGSGLAIHEDDAVCVGSVTYHRQSSDIRVCPSCEEFRHDHDFSAVYGNESVCSDCADNLCTCDHCDILVYSHDLRCVSGEDICPSCELRAARNNPWGRLLSYSDKSICKVKPKEPNKQLFGIEVECHVLHRESITDAIQKLHADLGDGYYVTKSDGSLTHGFEIVTRPDSMDVHRAEWVRVFESIANNSWLRQHLRSWEAPSRCCGIHVHIDKSMLSQMQLGKMLVFLNDPATRTFIQKVAGRGPNSYTTFEDNKKVTEGKKLKHGTSPHRYVALNVGRDTAEVRIFRGTLNPESFFKNLDFVEAVVEWTGLANGCSLVEAASAEAFCAFVHANAHRWPFLNNKLLSWGF